MGRKCSSSNFAFSDRWRGDLPVVIEQLRRSKETSGVLLPLVAFCLCSIVAFDAHAWSAEQTDRARAFIERYLDRSSVPGRRRPPGISIAIGVGGELVMADGFGDDGRGQRPNADTKYRIGSITKQFTAATVLRLIEQGAICTLTGSPLTLDTAAADILPGVENWTQPDQAAITVRSLLTMTSNLPNFTRRPPPDLDPWGAVELPELLGAVKRLKPQGWRSSFEYSNTSYFILASIIDAVTLPGKGAALPYRESMRALLLEPLGLDSTAFFDGVPSAGNFALPHHQRRPAFGAADWLRGSGDMVSSARDVAKWNTALLAGQALSSASLDAMFSETARVTPTLYYGMGWYVSQSDGCKLYTHSGSVPGYTAVNAICRDLKRNTDVSVTLLTNADGIEDLDDVSDALMRIAFEK